MSDLKDRRDGTQHSVPGTSNQPPNLQNQVIPERTKEDIDGLEYMKRSKQGKAVIINNKTFTDRIERKGTDTDKTVMETLLKDLGFDPIKRSNGVEKWSYDDVTAEDLKSIMNDAANDDYDEYSCFLCVILSYAEPGVIYCPRETGQSDTVELKKLQDPFKETTSLRLKPKIFLIQGCPYKEKTTADGGQKASVSAGTVMKIPRESDFLFHFSSYSGIYGWNNAMTGKLSHYIWALNKAVRELCIKKADDNEHDGDERVESERVDFLRVLTKVNNYMYMKTDTSHIPLVTSLLTKRICFDKAVKKKGTTN